MPLLAAALPLRRVTLFGSYPRGRFTAASDIDLLVIYEGEPRADAYALVRRTLDTPRLEPHVYSASEEKVLKEVIRRMEHGGLILWDQTEPGPPAP